ncbi:biopolymer transporter Tol, partial [bacterium]|nr:biopolymer transporter Tol [bacterium]
YSGLYAQPEAYNHPELDWNVIETEHFSVYYHNGLDRTPKILAKIAEEIYGPITSLYKYEPDGKIHIIVKDTDDYSNGAAYYYDNKIEIWATPMNFILRGTHNWLRCVLSHELAHIISLGTMRKMPRRFPALYFQGIGYEEEKRNDVLYGFPNVIMSYPFAGTVVPMWFAEGMAQHGSDIFGYDEWDSHRDMIIRMRVLNNDLLTLNQMGVFGKTSIGNESTYNQGYGLVKYIEEIHGREALEKLSRSMSSFTALSFNRAVKKVFGISQDELYGQWKEHIETYYRKKSQTISEHRVRGGIIEIEGSANLFPQWAPDGKMYAYLSNAGSDYISFTSLCINDIVKKERRLIKAGVSSSVSWSRDGKKLFYSKMGKCKNGSYFNDLYMYDFYKNKEKRLTFGKR